MGIALLYYFTDDSGDEECQPKSSVRRTNKARATVSKIVPPKNMSTDPELHLKNTRTEPELT